MERKLHEASMRGDVTSLMELLEEDPVLLNRVTTSFEYENPLGTAAMCGHVEFAKHILHKKPELATLTDQKGLCPLHLAAQGDSISMVNVLVEANPDVCSLTDQDGRSPLHLAAMRNRTEIMKILIEKQPAAIRMLSEYRSETILHLCVKHNCLEALKLLLDELRNLKESIDVVTADDNKEPISVESKDSEGNTILHLAVARRNTKMIKYLLNGNTGVEINAVNNKGFTAMDTVIKSDQRELKDMEIQDILREAGVLQSDVFQQSDVYQKPPADRPKDEISTTIKKRSYERYDEWLKENKNTLMVVSSLIATMAFQGALNPPGGVWQETRKLYRNGTISDVSPTEVYQYPNHSDPKDATAFIGYLYAGSAVMSLEHNNAYFAYMVCICLGFFTAMIVIFLLLSGFRFKRKNLGKIFVRILIAVLWLSVTFMTVAYLYAMQAFVPPENPQRKTVVLKFNYMTFQNALEAWLWLMGIVISLHIISSLGWLLRKLKVIKKKKGGESRMYVWLSQ